MSKQSSKPSPDGSPVSVVMSKRAQVLLDGIQAQRGLPSRGRALADLVHARCKELDLYEADPEPDTVVRSSMWFTPETVKLIARLSTYYGGLPRRCLYEMLVRDRALRLGLEVSVPRKPKAEQRSAKQRRSPLALRKGGRRSPR